MKQLRFYLMLLLTLSAPAFAVPQELDKITMYMADNLAQMSSIELAKVTKEACHTKAVSNLTITDCLISEASRHAFKFATKDYGEVELFDFRYISNPNPYPHTSWREHHFYGIWQKDMHGAIYNSDIEIVIWHSWKEPNKLLGRIYIKELDTTYNLVGKR